MLRLDRITIGDLLAVIVAAAGIGAVYYNIIGKHEALADKVDTNASRMIEIKQDTNNRLSRIEDKLDRLIEGQNKR